jgi:peptide/nickel transport system substrate-binding protein
MKRRIWLLFTICLITLSLVLASCTSPATTTTPLTATKTAMTTTATTTATTATPVATTDAPKYGGTLTLRKNANIGYFDQYYTNAIDVAHGWTETLGTGDYYLDPKIFNFDADFYPPERGIGYLAESWEVSPDFTTFTFHIRKGIRWQDKPPVNGRELVAKDFEYAFHRWYGMGSGFTKPSPYFPMSFLPVLKSVIATDKYTLVINTTQPTSMVLNNCLQEHHKSVPPVAYEVIEKYGDENDWRNVVGTGPFILSDYISGSSLTLTRNPNYWAYDERYPQNRLPYINQIKWLIIPDNATAYAALRTGKIDRITGVTFEQSKNLTQTNPEIIQIGVPTNGFAVGLKIEKLPFSDIKVRKAMQMSIDRDTIAKTYYGGTVPGTPCGLLSPSGFMGYATPFSEWSQQLKDEYSYNPQKAKQLLSEAGYPQGFKTNVVAASNSDLDLLQVVKSYLSAVGVDMEIRVMELVSFTAFLNAGKLEAMFTGAKFATVGVLDSNISGYATNWTSNYGKVSDPYYDDLEFKYRNSLDSVEQSKISRQLDAYVPGQHWYISTVQNFTFNLIQPWVQFSHINGFGGTTGPRTTRLARVWIDEHLKESIRR